MTDPHPPQPDPHPETDPDLVDPRPAWKRWWGRFSFALLAVAFVCGWEGNALLDRGERAAGWGLIALGLLCALLGLTGVRHRHRY